MSIKFRVTATPVIKGDVRTELQVTRDLDTSHPGALPTVTGITVEAAIYACRLLGYDLGDSGNSITVTYARND